MKDFFGNDIKIGDTVVFVNENRYSKLDCRIVTGLKEKTDKLKIFYSIYCYYKKLASDPDNHVIAKGGLHTAYTIRDSRNDSVIKNVSLQIEENT